MLAKYDEDQINSLVTASESLHAYRIPNTVHLLGA